MAEERERRGVLWVVVSLSNMCGVALIWAIMLLMCLDVLSRNLLNQPIAGVSYVVASAVVAIVFLQLASAIRGDRLTRTDFIYLPLTRNYPGAGTVLKVIFNLAGFAICVGIAWYTWPRLVNAWTRSEFVGIVGVMTFPRWPLVAITIFGASLAAIQFLANSVNDVSAYRRRLSERAG